MTTYTVMLGPKWNPLDRTATLSLGGDAPAIHQQLRAQDVPHHADESRWQSIANALAILDEAQFGSDDDRLELYDTLAAMIEWALRNPDGTDDE